MENSELEQQGHIEGKEDPDYITTFEDPSLLQQYKILEEQREILKEQGEIADILGYDDIEIKTGMPKFIWPEFEDAPELRRNAVDKYNKYVYLAIKFDDYRFVPQINIDEKYEEKLEDWYNKSLPKEDEKPVLDYIFQRPIKMYKEMSLNRREERALQPILEKFVNDPEYKNSEEFNNILEKYKKNAIVRFSPDNLRNNEEFVRMVAIVNPRNLLYIPEELKEKPELVMPIIKKHPYAIHFTTKDFQEYYKIKILEEIRESEMLGDLLKTFVEKNTNIGKSLQSISQEIMGE